MWTYFVIISHFFLSTIAVKFGTTYLTHCLLLSCLISAFFVAILVLRMLDGGDVTNFSRNLLLRFTTYLMSIIFSVSTIISVIILLS